MSWSAGGWCDTADRHQAGTAVTACRWRRHLRHARHRPLHVILRRLLQRQSSAHALAKPSTHQRTLMHICKLNLLETRHVVRVQATPIVTLKFDLLACASIQEELGTGPQECGLEMTLISVFTPKVSACSVHRTLNWGLYYHTVLSHWEEVRSCSLRITFTLLN